MSTATRAKAAAISLFLVLGLATTDASAGKPEDVFKGKIIITKGRLPTRFGSAGAFIQALQRGRTDAVWPKEERGNDHAIWNLEYFAFFATPLHDNEVKVKFFDVTRGGRRFVAGDEQYTRERGSRIFNSNLQIAMPEFEANKRYYMTVESGGRVIASTMFWLRGRGPSYSGKVTFTEEETKKR